MHLMLLVLLALLGPRPAHACTESCFPAPVLPSDGQKDVPLNARIWLELVSRGCNDQRTFTLAAEDGTELPIERVELHTGGSGLQVLTPNALLAPRTRYTLRDSLEGVLLRFETGLSELTDAPRIPRETSRSAFFVPPVPIAADSCGGSSCTRGVTIGLDANPAILVADLNAAASFDARTMSGSVALVMVGGSTSFTFWLSRGCGTNDTDQVRFGAFDIAGNFSGWGPASTVGRLNACACSGTGAWIGWGAVLAALAICRVRRERWGGSSRQRRGAEHRHTAPSPPSPAMTATRDAL